MPENSEFEYAIIRLVPKVEREEFINVGVIMYCRAQRFLQARYLLQPNKILAICPNTEIPEMEVSLNAFIQICEGGDESGAIGKLTQGERFRWLTATRSTIVQTSKVHPGFCTNAGETLERLYQQMVL